MRTWAHSGRPLLAGSRRRCTYGDTGDSGETQARLEAAQAAKISVPVLLITGEESSDPAKRDVGAVAAALPEAQLLMLAEQQHIADILDPATFAKHLLGFLHGPTIRNAFTL